MSAEEPSSSLTGPKLPRFWILAFMGYFVGSLGVVTGILALLKWYENASSVDAAQSRLIVSSVIVVILGSLVATFVHMSIDYRRRYHVHRDKGLVRDLYPDRGHLINSYHKVLADAKTRLRVVGYSNHTFMTAPGLERVVRGALSRNKGLCISLVFAKPHSHVVRQREIEEARGLGRISRDCVTNIRCALRMKSALGSDSDRLRVYVGEKYSPIAFTLQRDDEVYFEPYLPGSIGRTCPTFVIARNPANEGVFDEISHAIDVTVDAARELTSFPNDLRSLVTERGESESRKLIKNAIFLDRDGVLVEDTGYINSPDGLHFLPRAIDGLRALQDRFRLVIITNQSGVARGYFSEEDLAEIHDRLIANLSDHGAFLDGIYYCPHHPEGVLDEYRIECDCRKPDAGLIRQASSDLGIDLNGSYMVGDSERDMVAGKSVGLKTIQVCTNVAQSAPCKDADRKVATLAEAAEVVLKSLKAEDSGPDS